MAWRDWKSSFHTSAPSTTPWTPMASFSQAEPRLQSKSTQKTKQRPKKTRSRPALYHLMSPSLFSPLSIPRNFCISDYLSNHQHEKRSEAVLQQIHCRSYDDGDGLRARDLEACRWVRAIELIELVLVLRWPQNSTPSIAAKLSRLHLRLRPLHHLIFYPFRTSASSYGLYWESAAGLENRLVTTRIALHKVPTQSRMTESLQYSWI